MPLLLSLDINTFYCSTWRMIIRVEKYQAQFHRCIKDKSRGLVYMDCHCTRHTFRNCSPASRSSLDSLRTTSSGPAWLLSLPEPRTLALSPSLTTSLQATTTLGSPSPRTAARSAAFSECSVTENSLSVLVLSFLFLSRLSSCRKKTGRARRCRLSRQRISAPMDRQSLVSQLALLAAYARVVLQLTELELRVRRLCLLRTKTKPRVHQRTMIYMAMRQFMQKLNLISFLEEASSNNSAK